MKPVFTGSSQYLAQDSPGFAEAETMRYFASTILFALAALTVAPSGAAADFQIVQQVKYQGWGQSSSARFHWNISKRKFRLDVSDESGVRHYVFNGRVFYSCGRLDKKQARYVRSLGLEDEALLANLEKGSCQEVSADFMVRFFFSPYAALADNAISDGMTANITVNEPKIEITGRAEKIKGMNCAQFERTFRVTEQRTKGEHNYKESACHAPKIKWRDGLARELGKLLMRQRFGRTSYRSLKADLKRMAGMSLTVSLKNEGRDPSGKGFTRLIDVKTLRIDKGPVDARRLARPKDHPIVDPKNLAALGKPKPRSGDRLVGNGGEDSFANVLSYFLIGGSPAAAIVHAAGKASDE